MDCCKVALRRRLPLAAVLVLAACGGGSKHATSLDCAKTSSPAVKGHIEVALPTQLLDTGKTYVVHLKTNHGSFAINLATKTSPSTSASFVNLVRKGYFDHTVFHRIVPGFVIQGGDPTATGQGGPGYSCVDTPPASTQYTHGVVAMAKTGAEPDGTSGSQFFVVTAQDAQLPPQYAVLGTVTSGLAVVDRIGRLGDAGTEQPTEKIEILKATVTVQ